MSRFTSMAAACVLAFAPFATAQPGNVLAENPEAEFAPGEILLAFHPGIGAEQAADAARQRLGAIQIKQFAQIGVHHWRLPHGLTVDQAIGALAANPNVKYAEPNYIVRALEIPNDEYFYLQYNMRNTGQLGGTPDADIDAPEAWDVQTGSAEMVVAVIDTGIDYTHEDLVENMWINPGEDLDGNGIVDETDFNGIDDDGNGYVDDVRGWDFINNDNDPFDDHGHGTHCAGTIGAKGNNGIGVAGLNWTVQLMPLKFLPASGSGSTSDAMEAVLYAAEFGVPVTNNSWGGGGKSRSMEAAIQSAGALFVAAAGNEGSNRRFYPAAYSLDNVISVAATDRNDELAYFSNYSNSWVDLAAPGVGVQSTVPMEGNCAYCYWRGVSGRSGTSMAAPHVAGVAALVMAHDPTLDILTVKDRILSGVDPLPSLVGKTLTGGRLNAFGALTVEPAPGEVTVSEIDPTGMMAGTNVSVVITGLDFQPGATVTFENGSGPEPVASDVLVLSTDTITATITAPSGGPWGVRVWDVRVTNLDASTGTLPAGFTVIR